MKLVTKIEGTDLRFRLEGIGGNEYNIILEKNEKLFGFLPKWERVKKFAQSIDTDRADAMHKFTKFSKTLYETYLKELSEESSDTVSNHKNFIEKFPASVQL
jgi:hypothetical protein